MAETSCTDVMRQCAYTLEKKDEAITALNLALTQSRANSNDLAEIVTERDSELSKFWHNPWAMLLIGGVVGALVAK